MPPTDFYIEHKVNETNQDLVSPDFDPDLYREVLVKATAKSESATQSQYLDCTDCIYRDYVYLDDRADLLRSIANGELPKTEVTPRSKLTELLNSSSANDNSIETVKQALRIMQEQDDATRILARNYDNHPTLKALIPKSQAEYEKALYGVSTDLQEDREFFGKLSELPSLIYSGRIDEAKKSMDSMLSSVGYQSDDEKRARDGLLDYFKRLSNIALENPSEVKRYTQAYDDYVDSLMTGQYMYDALKTSPAGKKFFN